MSKESDLNISENDPISFSQVVNCDNFEKWLNTLKKKN